MKRRIYGSPFKISKVQYVLLAMLLAVSLIPTYGMLAFGGEKEDPSISLEEFSEREIELNEEELTTSESEMSDEIDAPEEDAESLYTPQPDSVLDVWYLIQDEVLPRWECEVERDSMPFGYYCLFVENDPDFELPYYTYAKVMPAFGRSGGNWSPNGETGTAHDPFKIEDAEDLAKLAALVNTGVTYSGDHFIVTNDIDLTTYLDTKRATYGWISIGYQYSSSIYSRVFSGTFDGQGNTISGLWGVRNNGDYSGGSAGKYGLFGKTSGATIKNLNVRIGTTDLANTDVKKTRIRASFDTGGLVGLAARGTSIESCTVSGGQIYVDGGGRAGGLVGWGNEEGSDAYDVSDAHRVYITDCHVFDTKTYTSGNYSAGLIGVAWNTEIINSSTHNTDSSADIYAAGFAAAAHGRTTITNCYSENAKITGRTGGDNWSGGFLGVVYNSSRSNEECTISSCYALRPTLDVFGSSGGFAGGIYSDGTSTASAGGPTVEGCYVIDPFVGKTTTAGSYYLGGFVGKIWSNTPSVTTTVRNCFVSGGTVSFGGSYMGGFTGDIYGGANVYNCYTQANVVNTSTGGVAGGFAGTSYSGVSGTVINNCYATGSVNCVRGSSRAGAFIGSKSNSNTRITNSYATGTVVTPSTSNVGGFAGSLGGNNTVSNCYFDKTTTARTTAVGSGSTTQGITGLTTEEMIDAGSWNFSTSVKDNLNGKAGGAGSDAAPWYIDDDITYPYFYYQYDGHAKDEVNYFLGAVYYTTDGGATFNGLAQDRADFTMGSSNLSAYFKLMSQGAAQAYFPYVADHYPFGAYGFSARGITINAPTSDYAFVGNTLYSLGSISQSDIIAFTNVPYAEKGSDREAWIEGDEDTYTKRGDIINYWIKTINPSTDYEWRGVEIDDELAEGLTLVDGSVNITEQLSDSSGAVVSSTITALTTTPNAEGLYYACDYDSGTNRWTLVVHLPDHPAIDESTGLVYSVLTEYQVLVGKGAVSLFPLGNWIAENGDNIRNIGTTTGVLHHVFDSNVFFAHEAEFDDENTDPVYDAYKVSYHGNGGKFSDNVTEVYEEYHLLDASYAVLPNSFDTNGDGAPDEEFAYPGHEWQDWYYTATPTSADTALTIGATYPITYTLESNGRHTFSDIDIYADWKAFLGSIKIEKFENDGTTILPGAEFKLEKLDDQGNIDSSFTALHLTTGTDGTLKFENILVGTYQVTETKAPEGFIQLTHPFEVDIPYTITLPPGLSSEPGSLYQTVDPSSGYITYHYFDVTYQVSDQATLIMPTAGVGEPPYHLLGVLLLIVALLGGGLYRHKRLKNSGQVAA